MVFSDAGEVQALAEVLAEHHRAAVLDATGLVASAGFLTSEGAPGSRTVRVGHRCLFPGSPGAMTFAEVAQEESDRVAAYGQLLREAGWTVRSTTCTRPRLLAHRSSRPDLGSGQPR
ncbi:hypothetical protein [Streptacidiphilus sp. EB103A]|uniref:hypothetical protein n=1 Tax=Streptacidiphilus sp. EB103A TaxID=3156275 RepID=UPI003513F06F